MVYGRWDGDSLGGAAKVRRGGGGCPAHMRGFCWAEVSPLKRGGSHYKKKMVPTEGVEPTRYHYHRILSPARLPIPPRRLQGENGIKSPERGAT